MKGNEQAKQKTRASFRERVKTVVGAIPRGGTLSYREVARRAGSPRAWRAVGNILRKNYDLAVPCHRVIRSDGAPGGYNRGTEKKAKLLSVERSQHRQPFVVDIYPYTANTHTFV